MQNHEVRADLLTARMGEAANLLKESLPLVTSGIAMAVIAQLMSFHLEEVPTASVDELEFEEFWMERQVNISALARDLDVSRPALLAAFQRCEGAGLLKVERRHQRNFVTLTPIR